MENSFGATYYPSLMGASVPCDTVRNRYNTSNGSHFGHTRTVTIHEGVLRNLATPAITLLSGVKEGVSHGVSVFAEGVMYCPKKLCEWCITIAQAVKRVMNSATFGSEHSAVHSPSSYSPSDEGPSSLEYPSAHDELENDVIETQDEFAVRGYSREDYLRDQTFAYRLPKKEELINDELLEKHFQTLDNLSDYMWEHDPLAQGAARTGAIIGNFEQFKKWFLAAKSQQCSDDVLSRINKAIREWQNKLKTITSLELSTDAKTFASLERKNQAQSSSPVSHRAQNIQQGHHDFANRVYQPQLYRAYVPQQVNQRQAYPSQQERYYPVHQQPAQRVQLNYQTPLNGEPLKGTVVPDCLRYDPYLTCHKCKFQFREGDLPEYRHHIDHCQRKKKSYTPSHVYVSDGINGEIKRVADNVRSPSPEVAAFYEFGALDPNLICHKCRRQFHEGQLPEYRHHIDYCQR